MARACHLTLGYCECLNYRKCEVSFNTDVRMTLAFKKNTENILKLEVLNCTIVAGKD